MQAFPSTHKYLLPILMLFSSSVFPSEEVVKQACKINGCDFHRFYKHLEQNKLRYCKEKKLILSSKRKRKYLAYILGKADEYNVRPSVAMLPIIESSLQEKAKSLNDKDPSIGMWQFKRGAAKDMGLSTTSKNDERYNWKRSTDAGVKYISWLKKRFDGDEKLAILSYNVGVGNIRSKVKELNTNNAWHISQALADNHSGKNYLMKYFGYYITFTVPEVCAI